MNEQVVNSDNQLNSTPSLFYPIEIQQSAVRQETWNSSNYNNQYNQCFHYDTGNVARDSRASCNEVAVSSFAPYDEYSLQIINEEANNFNQTNFEPLADMNPVYETSSSPEDCCSANRLMINPIPLTTSQSFSASDEPTSSTSISSRNNQVIVQPKILTPEERKRISNQMSQSRKRQLDKNIKDNFVSNDKLIDETMKKLFQGENHEACLNHLLSNYSRLPQKEKPHSKKERDKPIPLPPSAEYLSFYSDGESSKKLLKYSRKTSQYSTDVQANIADINKRIMETKSILERSERIPERSENERGITDRVLEVPDIFYLPKRFFSWTVEKIHSFVSKIF